MRVVTARVRTSVGRSDVDSVMAADDGVQAQLPLLRLVLWRKQPGD